MLDPHFPETAFTPRPSIDFAGQSAPAAAVAVLVQTFLFFPKASTLPESIDAVLSQNLVTTRARPRIWDFPT
jgi:hypothetical protein